MKKAEPVRFGIIGTGNIADNAHAPALGRIETGVLWSVYSRDKQRAVKFAERHHACAPHAAHSTMEEFLQDPLLEAVIITSPDKLHVPHILACAGAGKHVLVEKPFCTNHAEGLEAIETCKKHNVKLGIAFHLRWHQGHRQLHNLVKNENKLGTLRHIKAQWTFKAPDALNWRAHNELGRWWSLAATGSHCIDLIQWFAGASCSITNRSLINKKVWKTGHDETAIVLLQYPNGLTAESVTSVLFDSPSRLELYGEEGFAICERTFGRAPKGSISINGIPLEFDFRNPFDGEIEDFAAAIRHDREPEVSGLAGLNVVNEMIKAIENET